MIKCSNVFFENLSVFRSPQKLSNKVAESTTCSYFLLWPTCCYLMAWKKSLHFRDATTGFPAKWRLRSERRNPILNDDVPLPTSGYCFWLDDNQSEPLRSTPQIWVVTRHQYGIIVLVSQASFRGQTSGVVAKCQLFSQATILSGTKFMFIIRVQWRRMFLEA